MKLLVQTIVLFQISIFIVSKDDGSALGSMRSHVRVLFEN